MAAIFFPWCNSVGVSRPSGMDARYWARVLPDESFERRPAGCRRGLGSPARHPPDDADFLHGRAMTFRAMERRARYAKLPWILAVEYLRLKPMATHATFHLADDHRTPPLRRPAQADC